MPDAAEMTEPDSRSGLARAVSVINLLAESSPDGMGVSAVSRELQLPKTVAHRILKELVALAFLRVDESTKHYHLGPGALRVGMAALRGLDVPVLARPYLRRLVQETGETATLSVRQGWERVYIDQVLSPHEIRMSVPLGTSHPLHAGSSSKAILAALSDEEIQEYLDSRPLTSITGATITSRAELRAEITRIREVGYATSLGERQSGAGSVAAPVFTVGGDVFGSISLCGPLDRFGPAVFRSHGELVAKTAREVSAELGHRPQKALGA
ncbi:transcriptional regulator, IclR family [Pseudonocardia thermophila]|jgi:Transcriptional regulator|uniref:Transcriptional regulator, IclR family n=1 Tax=Pseudonocardia thermophila TaxID=1848 RepID=A0A1M6WXW5_PSETH|nr:IclR family transcriptional regulator [Pseudonocardia thermophila]SHK98523.1 transcriptional regulator, IclR family [Pseudonocardia thermophila]